MSLTTRSPSFSYTDHVLRLFCVAALLACNAAPAAAAPVAVTTCGQEVIGEGELIADLDCTTYADRQAVLLSGTLHLNGFTLTGNPALEIPEESNGAFDATIQCTHDCTILGPGTVTGGHRVQINTARNLLLRDADIVGTPTSIGVNVGIGSGRLERVTVTGNGSGGVLAGRRGRIIDSVIIGNGDGVGAVNLKIVGSTISGNTKYAFAHGVHASRKAKITGSTVSDNGGRGVNAGSRATIKQSTIANNAEIGLAAGNSASIRESSIVGNGLEGFVVKSPKVRKSSNVENNCTAPSADATNCADLRSCSRPNVSSDSTCGTSLECNSNPPASWSVCSLD
jgi:hypothetical protein